MSLIGALNIGKTALAAHQAAIQVSSNNIANAGNADYTRQSARLSPGVDVGMRAGVRMGSGVYLDSIARQVDDSLEQRIRGSISDEQAAGLTRQYLDRVEAVFNALGEDDLASQFFAFFNSWSNLANTPLDQGLRQVVVQTGETLANTFKSMRAQFTSILGDTGSRLTSLVSQANQFVDQVARLNQQIATAESGSGAGANALRDQRDSVLKQLSELIDIQVQDTGNGMVNVMVGSEPVVLQNVSSGLTIRATQVDGQVRTTISTIAGETQLSPGSGRIGALLNLDANANIVNQLDNLAGNLIFELNKLHSAGQGTQWQTGVTAEHTAAAADAALDSSGADLPFQPVTGSFLVQVRQKSTGLVTSQLISVDLDGQNADDTTLEGLANELSTAVGLTASAAGGRLKLSVQSEDYEFAFAQDTSGVLAALGINGFFKGTNAADIGVAGAIKAQPNLIAAAANGERGDNGNARAIAQLQSRALSGLNGMTLGDGYQAMVTAVATESANARVSQQAAQAVSETLSAQRESLSGVSLDEEAINLIREQRAFQAAARVIATIDEMMKTLLQIA